MEEPSKQWLEILLEMERFGGRAKAQEQGALALVLDLAKAFAGVSLPVVWATKISFPRLCGYSEHQRRVQFERMRGGAAPDHHGYLARVKVELLASTYCVAGCTA